MNARPWLPTLLTTLLVTACARGPQPRLAPIADAIHGDRWLDASLLASNEADPVAGVLVDYFRLLVPGAGTASELADFMSAHPDWPNAAVLARRYGEALAGEPDDATAARLCKTRPPASPAALLRCAVAARNLGDAEAGAAAAREAWTDGIDDAAGEAAFLRVWGGVLTDTEQVARFERLAWSGNLDAARRQAARLPASLRAMAAARVALRRGDPAAPSLLAALSPDERGSPGVFYDEARYLRQGGQEEAAAGLWRAEGDEASRQASPEARRRLWQERELVARHRLRDGDAAGAQAIACGDVGDAAMRIDADFLCGWIALRNGDSRLAAARFRALADGSKAAITQGRANYWLGRALAARGDQAGARAAYEAAGRWPVTYYGQLALRAAGHDDASLYAAIDAARDPDWTRERAIAVASDELTRAALHLVAWGDAHRAGPFLLREEERLPAAADRSVLAHLALLMRLPDEAVAIARRAGRDGVALPEAGWPAPFDPPDDQVDRAVSLGIMRQESSFDAGAVSPAGALGLMQLMPATAAEVARGLGESVSARDLTDPATNMRLGTAYLKEMLDRFGGALPFAAAAYNAGPNRVPDWLSTYGDPTGAAPGHPDMIDWIEMIPFGETRNYVQRVIENAVIYRARLGGDGHPLAQYLPGLAKG